MRKLIIVMIVVLMLLTAGCTGGEKSTATSKTSTSKYSGFMDWKAGMWSETVTKTDGKSVTTRMEIIENSPSEARFQMIVDMDGQETVSQMWIDRNADKVTKYVVKSGDNVICLDTGSFPASSQPSEGDSYSPDKTGIVPGTYETPDGDTVVVAKFKVSGSEAWVSSEVPFGIVKLIQDGKTVMSLKDYGVIGAKSRIDEKDIDCSGSVREQEAEYEPLYETSDESYDSQEYDYEQYYEEESSGTDEDVNYAATAVDRNTGEDTNFNCDDCQDMPAMARSACLASCR